jgi:glycosyltransferase involved in cell wall biosynthesis
MRKLLCDVLLAIKTVSLLRRQRYQVIHAVEEAVFIARLGGRLFGVPYVYDMDSSMSGQIIDKFPWLSRLHPLMQWFECGAMQGSCGIVAVCRSLEELARNQAPQVPVLRLEDVSLLSGQHPEVEDLRQIHGADRQLLLYVGNLEGYQGMDLLLEAMALLPQKVRQGSGLVVIGGSQQDIHHYEERASALGIAPQVVFLGPRPVDQLGGYLIQADILVSPRLQGNNTPMKIYSYLDAGRAVLATDLPTHTQVLDRNIAMLAAPEAGEFMRAMVVLLANENLRKELALAAKERVEQEFSRPAFSRKLTRFYTELESRLASRV